MAQKVFMALLLVALTAGGVFAQLPLSAGFGGFFGGDFGGGYEYSESYRGEVEKEGYKLPYFGGGAYAFLDAGFLELTLGIYAGKVRVKEYWYEEDDGEYEFGEYSSSYMSPSIVNLNIGLFGKYPIELGNKLTVFPLAGIDYALTLSAKDKDGNDFYDDYYPTRDGTPSDFSALWFKIGGGFDFALTEQIYLRFKALYGIRLASKIEKDLKEMYSDYDEGKVKTRLGHGIDIKLAIGFMF